jgi:hypothetical protein
VIAIDVALSRVYKGTSAFLVIEGTEYYTIHQGQRVELPVDNGNVAAYLRTVQQLDSGNSALLKLAEKGDK